MVVNILWFSFINVMRVKAVVVNLSSSKCSISCVYSEVLRSYHIQPSHCLLYAYALELNAVAYAAGFVRKVVLKKHEYVLCQHTLLKCNTDYRNVKSEAFCILSFTSIARRVACTQHLMLY
jgi:hypothetical protein